MCVVDDCRLGAGGDASGWLALPPRGAGLDGRPDLSPFVLKLEDAAEVIGGRGGMSDCESLTGDAGRADAAAAGVDEPLVLAPPGPLGASTGARPPLASDLGPDGASRFCDRGPEGGGPAGAAADGLPALSVLDEACSRARSDSASALTACGLVALSAPLVVAAGVGRREGAAEPLVLVAAAGTDAAGASSTSMASALLDAGAASEVDSGLGEDAVESLVEGLGEVALTLN